MAGLSCYDCCRVSTIHSNEANLSSDPKYNFKGSTIITMSIVQAASQQPLAFPFCIPSTFALPEILGVNIDLVEANVVQNASETLPRGLYIGHPAVTFSGLDFCNVSILYTHHGDTDPINVQVLLPGEETWNGRMMAVGGGGWAAGLVSFVLGAMKAGVNDGYVTVGTDAGLTKGDMDTHTWSLNEKGEVNMYLLETFAYTAYDDLARIGKTVTEQYYGTPPKYSYWNGCSQGGRQGLAAAQRYPEAFDGILAMAPAINWGKALAMMMWPQVVMNEKKEFPTTCELTAVQNAAIKECDLDDGVPDGILSNPAACKFNPYDMVGAAVDCPDGNTAMISEAAARAAVAVWEGPVSTSGKSLWYGMPSDTRMTLSFTACEEDGSGCRGVPFQPSEAWLRYFLAKDPNVDLTSISHADYERMFNQSFRDYESIIGTSNPDLSDFRQAGGKMIMLHGLIDQLIPVRGSQEYYDRVSTLDPAVKDYFRYFEAPGFEHCFGGPGLFPERIWDDLVAWVGRGRAPDVLIGTSAPNATGQLYERPICAYPQVARYDGTGDWKDPNNHHCAEEHLSSTSLSDIMQRTKTFLMEAVSTGKPSRDEL